MSHTLKSIPLLLVMAGLVLGQQPTPRIPALPGLPGAAGGTSEESVNKGPQNLTQELKRPEPDAQVAMEINFRSMDGYTAAALYQSFTGKRVLVNSSVAQAEFSFVQPPPLTNAQAARLLEELFLMEGFEITASTRDPNIVKLVAANTPGGGAGVVAPTPVIDDPASLSLHDGVVSYVMTFQYLKPEEAQRAFTQIFAQLRPGGTIAEVKNASSLIITEKAELIEKMVELKEKIDVPSAQVAHDFVEVRYADVVELSDMLNDMFNSQSSGNQSARVERAQQINVNPNAPPIPGLTNPAGATGRGQASVGEETPLVITPDSRTNRIFMMGRPLDIAFIKELITRWDVPSDQRNFLRVKLRYLPVFEFIPVAESAIARTLGEAAASGGGASGGASSRSGTAGIASGNGGQTFGSRSSNGFGNNSRTGATQGGFGGQNGGGGFTSGTSLSGQPRPTEPKAIQVGNTLLVSDNVSNSIIVQGPPHHIELVENLLKELDVRNEQVAITAVFGRYNITNGITFDTNLAQLFTGTDRGIGLQTRNGASFISPATISTFANLATTTGSGISLQGYAGDFGLFINALEKCSNFRSFARPTIFTTNNTEATIVSGAEIAVPTNSFAGGVNNGTTTNVSYRNVALELLVRPLVNSPEEITLDISIVRNTPGTNRVINENLTIPDINTDQLNTRVTVPNGAAVLLGGLISDEEMKDDSGVPILRSIPLIGRLFKDNTDSFTRDELVIMIRPLLIENEIATDQFQRYYDYGSNISGEVRAEFDSPSYQSESCPDKRVVAPHRITPQAQPVIDNSQKGAIQLETPEKKKSFARKHKR